MPDEKDNPDLRDPLVQLLEESRTNPDDAHIIAQFLDISVLTELFRKHQYNAAKKIETLLKIIKTGTHTEKMRAIKMIDEIWEQALVRRGMLGMGPGQIPPGGLNPLGLPQIPRHVESVEMTSTRVRMALGNAEEPKDFAPPKPNEENRNGEDNEEDGEYYRDDRAENCNIARPPSGQFVHEG